jgi:hypothetical protein
MVFEGVAIFALERELAEMEQYFCHRPAS